MPNGDDFSVAFQALTGFASMPWQGALFDRFLSTGEGNIPASCNLPTGLGKTSVIAIWLIALAKQPTRMPRRLVYVVNRRTVVDQTTTEVENLRRRLENPPDVKEHAGVLKQLRADLAKLSANGEKNPLAISTLRGQFADNREWSADPSRPAVICGTVDMIGSRLLFSGYGVGFRAKPLHAGFLGQDSLLVHDEAHLEPAFQKLIEKIRYEQACRERTGELPWPKLRVMELTATSREQGGENVGSEVFELTEEEKNPPDAVPDPPTEPIHHVWQRLKAGKRLHFTPIDDESKVGEEIGDLTMRLHGTSGRAILVFVRKVEDVAKLTKKLPAGSFEQLTGTLRGLERDALVKKPIFQRFLPEKSRDSNAVPAEGTAYLVCTSAGEVGVDISADHMVCDLSTFESMAQRFGRVNRYGYRDDTRIDVVHPATFGKVDKKTSELKADEIEKRRQKTLELLKSLPKRDAPESDEQNVVYDASPPALGNLDAALRLAAFSPKPTILPATDILFDVWSLTSIRGKMPGRPPVEPYLHGVRDWEPPETRVAWREEVGVVVGELIDAYPPEDLLDEYPLKPHELLRDRTDRVTKELVKLADRWPQAPIWIVGDQGTVEIRRLSELAKRDKDAKKAEVSLGGKNVLLPHDVGGLTAEGMLKGDYPPPPKQGEEQSKINNDVADALIDLTEEQSRPLRVRAWSDDEDFDAKTNSMRLVLRIDLPAPEEDEDAETRAWHWFERPTPSDNSKNALQPVLLDVHVGDVERCAAAIVAHLPLDEWIKQAVRLAASFHDLGKQRELWQRSIGRPRDRADTWYAKSGRRWKSRDLTSNRYRHEFGSLVDLQSEFEFQSLGDVSQDLVMHLIAAHHGQARPLFSAEQIIDPKSTVSECERLAVEVPRRYARLQRIFGRWGLAYLESLLRAADWAASAEPTASEDDQKGTA